MGTRGILAAFAVALSVVLMAGPAQSGADLLRADRAAATDTERKAADTGPAVSAPTIQGVTVV
ncbi:hypothetical protein [Streptomyces sp. NPDC004266]|uniref:hypothetical protein n=1 Tax=Streptomyces sp. NPDC004266 TaxID=3364693 RepID=UPI003696F730